VTAWALPLEVQPPLNASRPRVSKGTKTPPHIQPRREFLANKRKQMKANERKIAFICFHLLFRIGTFQWVTADSNKKILPAISGCARRFEVRFGDVRLLLVGSLSTAGFNPATANGIAQISIFAKG
jgi:hypothetical protein